MAENNANANTENQGLISIQSNVFEPTPAKEEAFKRLPGAAPVQLSDTARERVESYLVRTFYATWKESRGGVGTQKECLTWLKTLFQSTGALVSGGYMLRALGAYDFPSTVNRKDPEQWVDKPFNADIDVYVSCKSLLLLEPLVAAFKPVQTSVRQSSLYCNSFLKRNKIRRVYTFQRVQPPRYDQPGLFDALIRLKEQKMPKEEIDQLLIDLTRQIPGLVASMDIMSVRNSKSPLEVVQNFDLTFCQVWYDGKNVFATHPDHIVQRVGYLQGDYVKLFMAKNEFLKKRLEKYTQRGFEIRFDPAMLEAVANPDKGNYIQLVCKTEVSPRTPDHYKRWAMHKLLQFIVTKHVRETDYSIRERANKNEVKLNIPDFHFGDGDGYDSEDYDFDTKSPLFAFAEKYAAQHDADLAPLTPEEKFYQLASRCVSMIYSVDENESIFDYITHYNSRMENEAQIQRLVRLPIIKPYIQALKNGVKRTGNDMMYGDVTQLFDFHAHKLDRAVGLEFLDGYLDQNKMNLDKNELKCYLPLSECSKYLTLDDLRPFASLSAYKQYLTTRSPQVIAALDASNELGRITDFGLILRDVAVDTNDWGDINRHTMCPFCLRGEPRDGGCQYMTHYHQGAKDIRKLPYCKKSEQVKEVWQKYRTYQAAIPVDEYGPQGLMWCAICGAPCHGHRHFDSQNPGALKAGIQDEQGVDDYGLCPGGGRPEMIARMLAVRAVMLAHRDDPEPDHEAIRREAAIAADEAPRDPSLMARAEAIFAQEAATRRFDNVGLNEYSMAPEGAPLVNNDENNNGINEQPLAPAANLFVGGTKGHTRKRKSSLKRRLYTRKN